MHLKNVTLELSSKPFTDESEATMVSVCRKMFTQWLDLIRSADQVSVMLWIADGSEIFEYTGDLNQRFEWAYWCGCANHCPQPEHPTERMKRNTHVYPVKYRADAAPRPYSWLKRLIEVLRETGTEITGKAVRIGATYDNGPEFAISPFKYKKHREIAQAHTIYPNSFVTCTARLHADPQPYAAFPDGIPEGTSVGTFLGFISRYSWLKPVIDTTKCNGCGLCARNCKAACINSKAHTIDYSRCVVCLDCLDKCSQHAISYTRRRAEKSAPKEVDTARRTFITTAAAVAATGLIEAQEKKVDGGLAAIEDKKIPNRTTRITPPGSLSIKHFAQHCTGCQLCVSACPNGVLRPSGNLLTLMQPEMSYERGYCRPECTKCSEVCPAGAIRPITREEKTGIQIGHAVWVKANCVVLTDGVSCGNCARHCPSGAIQMVPSDPNDENSLKIPVVNTERCIGCGACENLCPARPFSAIYVEGHERHRNI